MEQHEERLGAKRCFRCHAPLSEDDRRVHIGVDRQELERLNLGVGEALEDDAKVIVILCHVCGLKEGMPSLHKKLAEARAIERAHRERTKPGAVPDDIVRGFWKRNP